MLWEVIESLQGHPQKVLQERREPRRAWQPPNSDSVRSSRWTRCFTETSHSTQPTSSRLTLLEQCQVKLTTHCSNICVPTGLVIHCAIEWFYKGCAYQTAIPRALIEGGPKFQKCPNFNVNVKISNIFNVNVRISKPMSKFQKAPCQMPNFGFSGLYSRIMLYVSRDSWLINISIIMNL